MKEVLEMGIIQILLVVVIVCAAIFILTYVAHDKGGEKQGEDCDSCNGDCLHCGKMPEKKQ